MMPTTLSKYLVVSIAVAAMLHGSPCKGDFIQAEFRISGDTDVYRARVTTDLIGFGLYQQLDLAQKEQGAKQWLITDRLALEGIMCPDELKPITLQVNQGTISAILVTGRGATTRSVHVVAVSRTSAPYSAKLRSLFANYYEGRAAFRYGLDGALAAFDLQYTAMHAVSDDAFPGHIILARTYKWLPDKQMFSQGPLHVDTEAEKKLTWLEAVTYTGSDRLGVSYSYDPQAKTSTRWFRPAGILRDKLPTNLRSAPVIEVVTSASGKVIRIRSIAAVPK